MSHTQEVTINHKDGLHLRPAALFVQTAAGYDATIQVRNQTKDTAYQDAKSAIGVMMLKASQGDTLEIKAEGDDAASAIQGLLDLIARDFKEVE